MKSVAATILKGHNLKRNVYLQIMLIGLSDLIWKVFVTIMNLTNEKNKQLNFFADLILTSIKSDLRLPLDKITYFEDIIIRFNGVDKIVYREKHTILLMLMFVKAKSCCQHKYIYNCVLIIVYCISFPNISSHLLGFCY